MSLIIAAGSFVLAVLLLTVPWGRRDPAEFSPVEVGYAARGPRSGLLAAVRLLKRDDVVEVLPRLDQIKRKHKRLPKDTDPLARAVFEALRHHDHDLTRLLDDAGVGTELQAVGDRVQRAGLRTGPARRLGGSAFALAAPVVSLIGAARDADVVTGIVLAVVSTLGAVVTFRLNGMTVAGRRTFGAARRRQVMAAMPVVRSAGLAGGSLPLFNNFDTTDGDFGGFGGFDGGGGSDGDSGSGY